MKKERRSAKRVWDISESLLNHESTGVDSVPSFKDFLRKTVEAGVKTARHETIRNEIRRLWEVSWMVLGWLGWIELLKKAKPHICFNLAVEAQADLEASVSLAVSGFVKQAIQADRSWMELTLIGIWFSYNQSGYRKWMLNKTGAPSIHLGRRGWLLDLLGKSSYLKSCEAKYSLSHRIAELYSSLSASTHTQGFKHFETLGRGKAGPAYRPKNFMKWFSQFWEAYSLLSLVLFLRYPSLYSKDSPPWDVVLMGMKGSHVDMLKDILGAPPRRVD